MVVAIPRPRRSLGAVPVRITGRRSDWGRRDRSRPEHCRVASPTSARALVSALLSRASCSRAARRMYSAMTSASPASDSPGEPYPPLHATLDRVRLDRPPPGAPGLHQDIHQTPVRRSIATCMTSAAPLRASRRTRVAIPSAVCSTVIRRLYEPPASLHSYRVSIGGPSTPAEKLLLRH